MLRIDRLTLMTTLSPENAELWLSRLNHNYRSCYQDMTDAPQDNLEPWKRFNSGIEGGRYRYSFDVTGIPSELAAMILPQEMWKYLRRIDYKWVGKAQPINWNNVYTHIDKTVPEGTRLSMFGSKMQAKKTDSSLPPGKGIRIGSHESDRSLVIYQKGDNLSIEVQLQKKEAKRIADATQAPNVNDAYRLASDMCESHLTRVLAKAGFASISHLVEVLASDMPVNPTLFDVEQKKFMQASPRQQLIMMLTEVVDKLRELDDNEIANIKPVWEPTEGYQPEDEEE